MKKNFKYGSLVVVLFLTGFFLARISNNNQTIKRTRILLGTVVEIQIRGVGKEKADEVITKAFEEISRIDEEFSAYKKESPVLNLNSSKDSVIKVTPEIYKIMQLSDSLWRQSKGAFDVSLESLTAVWGFNGNEAAVPEADKIVKALSLSGWKHIRLLGKNSFLRNAKVGLNFGAIAKGYAVDRAVDILKENGIQEGLVNAGGEIKALGSKWIIGVQDPRKESRIIAKIKLNGMSAATSGDYEQFFIKEGKRYNHIMNPLTGFPAENCRSVTVLAANNTEADGLSTAVFVLGPDEGIKLIEKLPGLEAMIIDAKGNMILSSGFNKYVLR